MEWKAERRGSVHAEPFLSTKLCKNIAAKFRESLSTCSAAIPQNCTLAQYFSKPFPKPVMLNVGHRNEQQ